LFAHPGDSLHNNLLQDVAVDVIEVLNIKTVLSHRVLAKLRHQRFILQAMSDVKDESRLPGRESGDTHVSFAAAVILVVILSEPDNAWSPHLRWPACNLLHQRNELLGILALPFILYLSDEIVRIDIRRRRLVFCHSLISCG